MINRLTPILPVADVALELAFYMSLGFEVHIDSVEEYPPDEFAAVRHGEYVLFGLARTSPGTRPNEVGLVWQFETSDLDEIARLAHTAGLDVVAPVVTQTWGRRTMTLRSPNGYEVGFEDA